MLRYLVQRLFVMIPTLLVISFLVFAIIQAPPGDFLESMMAEMQSRGENVNNEKIEFLRHTYGLDQPFYLQYLHWMFGNWDGLSYQGGGLIFGDMGYSFEHNLPVTEVIGDALSLTVVISIASILFVWVVSFPIAVYSATHQYGFFDYVFTFFGYLGLATPSFLIALVLLYFANIWFGTSVGGLLDPQYIDQPWSWGKFGSLMAHMWVPVLVIGLPGTAGMIRRLRANLLDELNKQYVVTGRAKGLPPFRLLMKYPLRISLNPFIADIGSLLPELISGSVVVSVVMSLPITGPILLQALRSQDMYLAGSFLMFMALLTVIGIFLSDLALAMLDPRIRFGAGGGK
jgi:peptide/nickel transport system permease protein